MYSVSPEGYMFSNIHFPAPYIFVPPIRDAICGSPILSREFFFPKPPPRTKVTAHSRERRHERGDPDQLGGTREVTRRAVEVGTRWLTDRANPRRSAPRWTRPKRKRTVSCDGGRSSCSWTRTRGQKRSQRGKKWGRGWCERRRRKLNDSSERQIVKLPDWSWLGEFRSVNVSD